MLEIREIRIENKSGGCVTDSAAPQVSFSLQSDLPGTNLAGAQLILGGNNHGSVEKAGENYYVFGHRQMNCHECSGQGVAERLNFEKLKVQINSKKSNCTVVL